MRQESENAPLPSTRNWLTLSSFLATMPSEALWRFPLHCLFYWSPCISRVRRSEINLKLQVSTISFSPIWRTVRCRSLQTRFTILLSSGLSGSTIPAIRRNPQETTYATKSASWIPVVRSLWTKKGSGMICPDIKSSISCSLKVAVHLFNENVATTSFEFVEDDYPRR
jgi:hypothetical protein